MSEFTRRRLLKGAAGAAGGAVAASLLPPNVQRVLAGEPKHGSVRDIEHVVVLMQENRSFDHYFGTLRGVRGFDDPDMLTLPNGRSVLYQPDEKNPDGYLLPFHLDTHHTSSQAIPSTSHAWTVQHSAWNDGKMDNWLRAHRKADGDAVGPYTMGYYERSDIPFQFALAEAFTICDGYFCSVLGPTWPNRLYLMSASIDPDGTHGGPIISNVVRTPYTWTTYPERLTAAGVSWRVYQDEDDYGCNVLEFFQAYQDAEPGSTLYESARARVRGRRQRGQRRGDRHGDTSAGRGDQVADRPLRDRGHAGRRQALHDQLGHEHGRGDRRGERQDRQAGRGRRLSARGHGLAGRRAGLRGEHRPGHGARRIPHGLGDRHVNRRGGGDARCGARSADHRAVARRRDAVRHHARRAGGARRAGRARHGGIVDAHGVVVAADGASVWVADSLRDQVVVLDADGRREVARVAVGRMPWNVALTADHAYVTNANDDTVSVIDAAAYTVVATVAVGHIPTGVTVVGDTVWVANNTSSTVSVIDVASNTVTATVDLGLSDEPTTIAVA